MDTISAKGVINPEWHDATRSRHSRRSYSGARLDDEALLALEEHCASFAPSDVARAVLIREAPENIFTGIVGSYGRIRGASSALVFLGQAGDGRSMVACGYTGEAAILEATRMGLDTCWVGGFFNAGRVARHLKMRAGEQVYAISPVGIGEANLSGAERRIYRMSSAKPKPRHSLDRIAPGWKRWPEWARSAAESARIAPSAYNRQPWRFRFDAGRLVVSFDGVDTPKTSKRLDVGIAMLNAEVGASAAGVSGHWEFADRSSDIAALVTD